jgi:hypothetical protein
LQTNEGKQLTMLDHCAKAAVDFAQWSLHESRIPNAKLSMPKKVH